MNYLSIKRIKNNIYGVIEDYHKEKCAYYLFIGKEKVLVFDTGMGIFSIKEVIDKFTDLDFMVVNSHFHFDHIGGNWESNNVYTFDHNFMKLAQKGFDISTMSEYFTDDKFNIKPKYFTIKNHKIKAFSISKFLYEGDIIDIEPFSFEVIHTPGHSDDSICLYEKNNKILLSADLIYPGCIYINNLATYKQSMFKISKLDIDMILPGHNQNYQNPKIIHKILGKIDELNPKIQIDEKTSLLITDTWMQNGI